MVNKYLLALACGDSYGSYYEYKGLAGLTFDIENLPDTPTTKFITDDTKMAKILLEHYFKYKRILKKELRTAYTHWAKTSGEEDGIGLQTFNVLIKKDKNKDSQGNGALMRNIPFALQLIEDGYSFEETLKLMNKDSFLTHENEVIAVSNELALDLALNGIKVLEKEKYKTIISKLHLGSTAWLIHSLYIVIEALKKDFNYLESFKYITSVGGDTDTNCVIFAAIRSYKHDIADELCVGDFVDLDEININNLSNLEIVGIRTQKKF